jgi:hypothetical protein
MIGPAPIAAAPVRRSHHPPQDRLESLTFQGSTDLAAFDGVRDLRDSKKNSRILDERFRQSDRPWTSRRIDPKIIREV